MRYEKTQKRNPHELTIDQHVFPAYSLGRFVGADGKLAVIQQGNTSEERWRPKDPRFCAKRAWDHQAESVFMKSIEDKFQAIANQITTVRQSLDVDQHSTVTDFFALWQLRAEIRTNPIPDRRITGIAGKQREYTADDQELLEKNGIGYINDDLSVPGRMLAASMIFREITIYKKRHSKQHWGIVSSAEAEFIVPDRFGQNAIVPVGPKVCLVADHGDSKVSESQVKYINLVAIASAKAYRAARSFVACPI